jgi:integrase
LTPFRIGLMFSIIEWTEKDVRTWKREDRGGVYFVKVPGTASWRSSGLTKKGHAVEWALKVAHGGYTPDVSLSEYAKDFFVPGLYRRVSLIEKSKGKNAIGHWNQLRQLLVDFILPAWGHRPLAMISPSEVFQWMSSDTLVTVRKQKATPHPLSAIRRNRILIALNQVFDQAVFEQILPANPLKSVPTLALDSKEKQVFTDKEVAKLFPADLAKLDAIWGGRSWVVLAMVLEDSGLRPAEALALRWRGWYPASRAFLVWESIKENGQPGPLKTAKKGVKKKVALVSSRTASLLLQLRGEAGPDAFVFPSTKFTRTRGQPMRTTTMTHHFAKALPKRELGRTEERSTACVMRRTRASAPTSVTKRSGCSWGT